MLDGGTDKVDTRPDDEHPHVDQLDADPHEGDQQDQLEHRLECLQEVLFQLGGEAVGTAHQPVVDLAHEGYAARHLQHVQRSRQRLEDDDAAKQYQDDADGDPQEETELSHEGPQDVVIERNNNRQY